ncbi:FAD binding domain-containing protein [Arthrobacter sp. StoSoilB13]|uniref:FAD binding domain-containing protein n=1 Tax=Arthrobacter sp. StoSoilB13 TaxID=2830993 RepID=UPI001CC7324A|nr:FAD binding domain-containing protein [Arthrobacter sp. StoSoilB13]
MRGQKLGAGLIAQSQSALPPFVLHRPTSLGEAVALTRQHPEAVIAAGCSDLVAQFREGLEPEVLISVQRIKELRAISNEDGLLRIGSLVSHAEGSRSPEILSTVPALAAAWGSIATVRIRYRGTLGGNLLARRYRYEMPVILSALGAQMQFQGGDIAALPVSSLWDRDPGNVGILTAVTVGTPSLLWFGYERSMRPLSTVSLAVRKNPQAGLTVTAVCGSEYRQPFVLSHTAEATAITELDPAFVGEVLAAQLPDEAGDYSGSIDYRRHLVGVLCRRLLADATGNQRKG